LTAATGPCRWCRPRLSTAPRRLEFLSELNGQRLVDLRAATLDRMLRRGSVEPGAIWR